MQLRIDIHSLPEHLSVIHLCVYVEFSVGFPLFSKVFVLMQSLLAKPMNFSQNCRLYISEFSSIFRFIISLLMYVLLCFLSAISISSVSFQISLCIVPHRLKVLLPCALPSPRNMDAESVYEWLMQFYNIK